MQTYGRLSVVEVLVALNFNSHLLAGVRKAGSIVSRCITTLIAPIDSPPRSNSLYLQTATCCS